MLFGGRIAEELFMNQMTTGASNDFERATSMARDMVTRYGMSDKLGPMVYGENEGEVFPGRSVTTHKNLSESHHASGGQREIRRIIDDQYTLARRLLDETATKVEVDDRRAAGMGNHRRRADRTSCKAVRRACRVRLATQARQHAAGLPAPPRPPSNRRRKSDSFSPSPRAAASAIAPLLWS